MNNKTLAWIVGGAALFAIILATSFSTLGISMPMMGRSFLSVSAVAPAGMMTSQEANFGSKAGGYGGMMDYALTADSVAYPVPAPSAGVTAAETEQKIIKTGYLDLTVADVAETSGKIAASVAGAGGFVQESQVSEREDGSHYASVSVRVPSAQFEAEMAAIKEFATVVKTESSQGQDVTEQYTDLEAQLRNAEAQETEYLKILAKATSVEDILNVQQYLGQIRGQIESLTGQIQYLKNATTYSTISVTLSEEPGVHVPSKGFNLFSTLKEAFQALVAIAQNLAVVAVWILVIGAGTLIPLAVLVWIVAKIVRAIRRR